MPVNAQNLNGSNQPADTPDTHETITTLEAVVRLQKKEAAENAAQDNEAQSVDIIQQKLQSNKTFFYGLPILVILYFIGAIFLFIVPSIQTYTSVDESIKILNKNLSNLKQSSHNLKTARGDLDKYEKYSVSLTEYVPTEGKLGSLIDTIQKRSGDYGLESEIGVPSQNSIADNSNLNELAQRDENNKSLFESLTSGEIEFSPEAVLSPDSKSKLLAIDVNIKGNKESFFKFLREMNQSKPILNLVYIDYQEFATSTETGEVPIRATVRFESYTLKLGESESTTSPLTVKDPTLLSIMQPETFELNPSIIEEFDNNSSLNQ